MTKMIEIFLLFSLLNPALLFECPPNCACLSPSRMICRYDSKFSTGPPKQHSQESIEKNIVVDESSK